LGWGLGWARCGAVVGCLDAAEDGGDFALELEEVQVDDGASGMEDDVDGRGEEWEGGADGFAQAALDAVAVDGFAEGFGDGEADAGAWGVGAALSGAKGVEVGDLFGELLAAGLVDELVVGVFAQAVGDGHGLEARCVLQWRKNGRASREKQVLRCAQDDN